MDTAAMHADAVSYPPPSVSPLEDPPPAWMTAPLPPVLPPEPSPAPSILPVPLPVPMEKKKNVMKGIRSWAKAEAVKDAAAEAQAAVNPLPPPAAVEPPIEQVASPEAAAAAAVTELPLSPPPVAPVAAVKKRNVMLGIKSWAKAEAAKDAAEANAAGTAGTAGQDSKAEEGQANESQAAATHAEGKSSEMRSENNEVAVELVEKLVNNCSAESKECDPSLPSPPLPSSTLPRLTHKQLFGRGNALRRRLIVQKQTAIATRYAALEKEWEADRAQEAELVAAAKAARAAENAVRAAHLEAVRDARLKRAHVWEMKRTGLVGMYDQDWRDAKEARTRTWKDYLNKQHAWAAEQVKKVRLRDGSKGQFILVMHLSHVVLNCLPVLSLFLFFLSHIILPPSPSLNSALSSLANGKTILVKTLHS